MNPHLEMFFDGVSDGVALVSADGKVGYANATCMSLCAVRRGETFPNPMVVKGVRDLAAGLADAPIEMNLKLREQTMDSLQARILPLQENIFAVLLHDAQEKRFYALTLQNVFATLREDLAEPLHRFVNLVDDVNDGNPVEADELIAKASAIAERLRRIAMLAEVFGKAPLLDQERLSFRSLFEDVLRAEATALAARKIEVIMNGLDDELPPVYGSRYWLAQAVRELVANAARHATPESKLSISLRCSGAHVVISLRNHGYFLPAQLRGHWVYEPFAAVDTGKGTSKGGGIGLAMVRQILNLHGGGLTIVDGSAEEIVEFNVELATGAPAVDTQSLDIQQAQRYALDMARLRQRYRGNTASNH